MRPFEFFEPASISEAVALLLEAPDQTRIIAGGSDLLSEMKDGLVRPARLVSLAGIPGLRGITANPGGVVVGAMATIAQVARHPVIQANYTALAQAAAGLATPQIRNVGTLGGNLNQRPRCWYYRHPLTLCLKKGGDRCFALEGNSKYLCVTGGDRCYIVHPSDTAVALAALDATIEITGPSGVRSIPVEQYFIGPDQDVTRETVLAPGEMVTRVHLTQPSPAIGQSPAPSRRSLYLKAREREAGDFALVSAAVALTVAGATVRHASVVLGGVAPVPYRAGQVERYLQGRPASQVDPSLVGRLALPDPQPMRDNAYKVALASNLVKRAVTQLLTP